jgi:hypothetical protein
MLLGAAGVGLTTLPHNASAEVDPHQEEEMACDEALRRNTIEALEDFLFRYPRGNSACHARALNALNAFVPAGSEETTVVQPSVDRYGG